MTKWREFKLSDLISIKHGYAFKGEFFSEEETPYILVTPGNFNIGGGFKSDKFKWYNGEIPTDYILKKDDLIVTMTDLSKNGDTLGYSALVPELNGKMLLHNQRIGLVEFKSNDIDKYFLYWLMRTSVYQKSIVNTASGSTVKHTSPDRICQFSFLLPPLDIQRKIAGILGALDDKIEVLRAQNKTLEQMAQAVFQSWFVDFDIVRAKSAGLPAADVCKKYHITPDIYDLFPSAFSADNLPLGWEKIPFSETMDIISGGTPKTTEPAFWNGEFPWYSVVDAPASVYVLDTEKHITKLGLEKSPCSLLEKDTVIISARGTVGKLTMVGKPMAMNQSCYGLKFDFSYYGYLMTKQMLIWLKQNVHGAVFDTITKDTFKTVQTVNVSRDLKEAFTNIVSSFFKKIYENSKQIRTLEQTRDTLLPQLLNGKNPYDNIKNILY